MPDPGGAWGDMRRGHFRERDLGAKSESKAWGNVRRGVRSPGQVDPGEWERAFRGWWSRFEGTS